MISWSPGIFNYLIVVFLMMSGFYVVIAQGNLIKKLVGLGLFQTSVFILYISIGYIAGGQAPIITDEVADYYSSPLPHVLILTAIVVGVATTSVGLALVVRIHEAYGSVEEDEIHARDWADDNALMEAELEVIAADNRAAESGNESKGNDNKGKDNRQADNHSENETTSKEEGMQ